MELVDHFADARDAARQIAVHIVLIAIVDADVRIDGPEQNGVDAAVALVDVVEIAIDRVFARDRVVEIPILDHHLRLNERRLAPFQLGTLILGIVIFDALAGVVAPAHSFS